MIQVLEIHIVSLNANQQHPCLAGLYGIHNRTKNAFSNSNSIPEFELRLNWGSKKENCDSNLNLRN